MSLCGKQTYAERRHYAKQKISLLFNARSYHHTKTVISVLTDSLLTAGYFIKKQTVLKPMLEACKGESLHSE